MKRFVILLLTAVLALTMPLSALAAGQIEVTEDISVSDDYDWTRFKGQNVTLNVYNWGEYISNGSDDSVDVVAAFEKLTGIKVNYTTFDSNESLYAAEVRRGQLRCHHPVGLHGRQDDKRRDADAAGLQQHPELPEHRRGVPQRRL